MKKAVLYLILVVLVVGVLSACGGRKCFDCGKTVDKGYEVFGNFYCEDCFM